VTIPAPTKDHRNAGKVDDGRHVKTLVDHIHAHLIAHTRCAVFEHTLERIWPHKALTAHERGRRIAIHAFAKANNLEATIYDPGIRVTFKPRFPPAMQKLRTKTRACQQADGKLKKSARRLADAIGAIENQRQSQKMDAARKVTAKEPESDELH
jgi:hypothetical protein